MSEKQSVRYVDAVIAALEEKKGVDVLALDVRGRCALADHFVLATATSDRHLKSLANNLAPIAHRYGYVAKFEGMDALEWVLADLGDIVVHLFLPDTRNAFRLEDLWASPVAAE